MRIRLSRVGPTMGVSLFTGSSQGPPPCVASMLCAESCPCRNLTTRVRTHSDESVDITARSLVARDEDVEKDPTRGMYYDPARITDPTNDQLGCIIVGPKVALAVGALGDNIRNAIASIHRHYQVVRNPLTLEELALATSAVEHSLDMLSKILTPYMAIGPSRLSRIPDSISHPCDCR